MDSLQKAKIECNKLKLSWTPTQIEITIHSLLTYLKDYDTECGTKTWIKNHEKIRASFHGNSFADCAPFDGEIIFGHKLYEHSFLEGSFGYKKEKDYINKRCKTKFDRFLWLVMHEYCHLFKHQQRHCIAFYQFIDDKYLQFFKFF